MEPNSPEISLWPYKLVFFSLYGAKGVMDSFLSLYFKELGLNPAQIGTVMFCKPIGGFLSGMTISYLSKRYPNQDKLISSVIILYIGSGLTFCFFPRMDAAEQCPPHFTNVTSTDVPLRNSDMELGDRSWMYNNEYVWLFLLCLFPLCAWVDFCLVVTDSLVHSVTVRGLKRENIRSYGIVRAWDSLGFGGICLTTGLVVSPTVVQFKLCGFWLKVADYYYMFYVFIVATCTLLFGVHILHKPQVLEIQEENGPTVSYGDFRRVICSPRNISFLVLLFCRSIFLAVTQGFLNWHMENIGATPALIGFSNFVTNFTEFVVFHFMPTLTRRFGEFKLAAIGITSYVLRFFVFSVIPNPIYILPVEIMEGVMYAFLWSSGVTYLSGQVNDRGQNQLQGLIQAIVMLGTGLGTMFAFLWSSGVTYLSGQVNDKGQNQLQGLIQAIVMLGTGLGLILSGELTQFFGAPTTFTIFSVLAAVSSIAFVLVQKLT